MRPWIRFGGVLVAAAMMGCAEDQQPPTAPGTGSVTVRLTDAPANLDQVNVVITGVQALRASNQASGTWETLTADSVACDLIQLQNGVSTTLGAKALPAGSYSRLRLMIGQTASVVVAGTSHQLEVPSALANGFPLIGFDLPAGGSVDILLDFDAARSIHLTGSGTYGLRPRIRMLVNPALSTGRIAGRVLPEGPQSFLYAIQGTDTLTAAIPIPDGHFALSALAAGSYDVAVDVESGYRDTTIAGVTVVTGQTNSLGNVHLTPE
jgi:hypothetical protein